MSNNASVKKQRDVTSVVLRALVWIAGVLTLGVLAAIVIYIVVKGVPNIDLSLFSLEYTSENASLTPALITTLIMTGLSLLIAIPLGIGSAIYLTEYAKRGNKMVKLVRVTAETLSGIPSIVYGLFGAMFFVQSLEWGLSIMAGAFTMAIMILPLIMRTTEEALLAVPDLYREGSFGLGAGRLRTVFKVVLPSAMPGVLAGVILAIGRIVGETAALLYTAGTATRLPDSIMKSGRTLSVHMYVLSNEGLHIGEAYATAAVLLIIVFAMNTLSAMVAKKIARGSNG